MRMHPGMLLLSIVITDALLCHEGMGSCLALGVCLIEPGIVRMVVVEEDNNLKHVESEASMEILSSCHLLIENLVLMEA